MEPPLPWTGLLCLWMLMPLFLLERAMCAEEVQCFVQSSNGSSCKVHRLVDKGGCYKELRTRKYMEDLFYYDEQDNNETVSNLTILYNSSVPFILLFTSDDLIWFLEPAEGDVGKLKVVNLPAGINKKDGVKGTLYPPFCSSDECGKDPSLDIRPYLVSHTIDITVIVQKNCDFVVEFFTSNSSLDCVNPAVECVDKPGTANKTVTFKNVYTRYHCFGVRINNDYLYSGINVTMAVKDEPPTLEPPYHFDPMAILIVVICLMIIAFPVGMLYRHAISRSLRSALSPATARSPLLQPLAVETLLLLYPRNSALLCSAVAALRALLDRALSIQVVDPFDPAVIEEVIERPQEWLMQRLVSPSVRVLLLPPPATAAAAAAPSNDFRLYASAIRFLQENPDVGRDYTRVFFAGFKGMPFADIQMGLIVPLKRFILPGHLRELVSEIERCPGPSNWRWENELNSLEEALERVREQHRTGSAPSAPPSLTTAPFLEGYHIPQIRSDEKSDALLISDLV